MENQLESIWEYPTSLKIFISHTNKHKKIAAYLKDKLLNLGIECFVAHEDIEPSKEWLEEITKALHTSDGLVALITDDFRNSDWTNQEIGFACCRNIPIIPISFNENPYGFMRRYQAITFKMPIEDDNEKQLNPLIEKISKALLNCSNIKGKIIEALVRRLETARSFDDTDAVLPYLEQINKLTPALIARIEWAFENNDQVHKWHLAKKNLPWFIKKWKEKNI